jgi:hypothetical protein
MSILKHTRVNMNALAEPIDISCIDLKKIIKYIFLNLFLKHSKKLLPNDLNYL